MNEAQYQSKVIKKLRKLFPGCHIEISDPTRTQGIPDLLILFRDKWAMLEVKISDTSAYQPNQEYYLEHFGQMSFTSMICPENEAEVLDALQQSFGVTRKARVS